MTNDGPFCQADGCERHATNQIHGIVLDGTEFSVYTCGEHDDTEARTIEEAKPFSDTARGFGEDVERALQETESEQ